MSSIFIVFIVFIIITSLNGSKTIIIWNVLERGFVKTGSTGKRESVEGVEPPCSRPTDDDSVSKKKYKLLKINVTYCFCLVSELERDLQLMC